MDEIEAGYRVVGRVQGVGFRHWTARLAQQLGVRGTVSNRPDGSVEVFAAGPAHAMAEFQRLLARGPAGADVLDVERLPPAGGLPNGFEIRR